MIMQLTFTRFQNGSHSLLADQNFQMKDFFEFRGVQSASLFPIYNGVVFSENLSSFRNALPTLTFIFNLVCEIT